MLKTILLRLEMAACAHPLLVSKHESLLNSLLIYPVLRFPSVEHFHTHCLALV